MKKKCLKRLGSIVFVVAIVCFGCTKAKVCHYGTAYNEATKDCECINYTQDDIPELLPDEYNSVGVVNKNFHYLVKEDWEYPYYSHEGDTILVYGWVWEAHPVASNEIIYVLIDQPSVPIGSSSHALQVVDLEQFIGICSIEEKCFVKGVLEFPRLQKDDDKDTQCHSVGYAIRVFDIHN
jgi:hypothetical protein